MFAFFRTMDKNGDGVVDRSEFVDTYEKMQLPGDPIEMLKCLRVNDDEAITLDSLETWCTNIWTNFKRWVVETFRSQSDLMRALCKKPTAGLRLYTGKRLSSCQKFGAEGKASKEEFMENLPRFGWYGGFESVLFDHLDSGNAGFVTAGSFSFFAEEMKAYKKYVSMSNMVKAGRGTNPSSRGLQALHSLKQYLGLHFNCLFGLWCLVLDSNCDGCVTRGHFEKAIETLGWQGSCEVVWRGLDPVDNDRIYLEDLAFQEARQLICFTSWLRSRFGTTSSTGDIDMNGVLKNFGASVRAPWNPKKGCKLRWFQRACAALHSPVDGGAIFALLDWKQQGRLFKEDMSILNKLKFREYMDASPNYFAASEFKDLLLRSHGKMLRAWRERLDQDDSGRLKWREFSAAVASLEWDGDAAGAWVALDVNGVGYLTLDTLDPNTYSILSSFRSWAWTSFGSVILAFHGMDVDGEGLLTKFEFGTGVVKNGFKGNLERTWSALNYNGGSVLTPREVVWLDDWELEVMTYCPEALNTEGDRALDDDDSVDLEFREPGKAQEVLDVEELLHVIGWQPQAQQQQQASVQAKRPEGDLHANALRKKSGPDRTVAIPLRKPVVNNLWTPRIVVRRGASATDVVEPDSNSLPWLRKAVGLDPEPRIYASTCSSRGRFGQSNPVSKARSCET